MTSLASLASFACETTLPLGGDVSDAGAATGDAADAGGTIDAGDGRAAGDALAPGVDGGPGAFEWALWPVPGDSPPVTNYDLQNGTALDKTTLLMWQQGIVPGRFTWSEATQGCAALRVGGFADWSLPSRIELVSIVDYESASSFNPNVFVDDGPPCFWSASPVVNTTSPYAWQIQHQQTLQGPTDEACAVRCVRNRGASPHAKEAIEFRGAVAVDHRTGLTWEQLPPGTIYTAAGADDHCLKLSLGGLSTGWRLPTIRELQTIVDEKRTSLALAPEFGAAAGTTWAQTGTVGYAWIVQFQHGDTIEHPIDFTYNARCVHP
jgi:hypothetical protein